MTAYNDTVIENVTVDEPAGGMIAIWARSVTENLTLNENLTFEALTFLIDQMSVSDTPLPQGIFHEDLIDVAEIEEYLYQLFPIVVQDIAGVNDSPIEVLLKLADIIESFNISENISTRANFYSALTVALTLSDLVERGFPESVLELIDMNESLVDLLTGSAIIIDQVAVTMVQQDFLVLGAISSDSASLSETLSLQQILANELTDGIVFVGAAQSGDFYNTYSFNPEGYLLSTYSNYNFNSITEFDNSYLLANSTGLYKMGGTTDNLLEIVGKLKSTAMDFGSSSKKQVKKMYLGLTNDSSIVLKVTVDGKGVFYYELDSSTVGLDTQAIKIGKGLVGRYWQFELITKSNSSLELDEIEFLPVEFRRKL